MNTELINELTKLEPNTELVKNLLKKYNPKAVDNGNDTYLHLVCQQEKPNITLIEILLEHGLDPNTKGNTNYTCLHYILDPSEFERRDVDIDVVKLLLKHGADPDIKNSNDENCLHIALDENNIEVVKLMVDQGANTLIYNRYYDTSLEKICKSPNYLEKLGLERLVNILFNCDPNLIFNKKYIRKLYEQDSTKLTLMLLVKKVLPLVLEHSEEIPRGKLLNKSMNYHERQKMIEFINKEIVSLFSLDKHFITLPKAEKEMALNLLLCLKRKKIEGQHVFFAPKPIQKIIIKMALDSKNIDSKNMLRLLTEEDSKTVVNNTLSFN